MTSNQEILSGRTFTAICLQNTFDSNVYVCPDGVVARAVTFAQNGFLLGPILYLQELQHLSKQTGSGASVVEGVRKVVDSIFIFVFEFSV